MSTFARAEVIFPGLGLEHQIGSEGITYPQPRSKIVLTENGLSKDARDAVSRSMAGRRREAPWRRYKEGFHVITADDLVLSSKISHTF
jgi:hypothetical protein